MTYGIDNEEFDGKCLQDRSMTDDSDQIYSLKDESRRYQQ